jgi:hypothetical protein
MAFISHFSRELTAIVGVVLAVALVALGFAASYMGGYNDGTRDALLRIKSLVDTDDVTDTLTQSVNSLANAVRRLKI